MDWLKTSNPTIRWQTINPFGNFSEEGLALQELDGNLTGNRLHVFLVKLLVNEAINVLGNIRFSPHVRIKLVV